MELHTKLGVFLLLAYIYTKAFDHSEHPVILLWISKSDFIESIDLSVAHGKHQSRFYLLLVTVSDKDLTKMTYPNQDFCTY